MRIYANLMNNKNAKKNSNIHILSSGGESKSKIDNLGEPGSESSEPLRPTFFVYVDEAQEKQY